MSKGVSCCNDDADDEGNGLFGFVLASLSLAIILLFLPFSLCACLKVSIITDVVVIVVIIFVLISPPSFFPVFAFAQTLVFNPI